MDDYVSPDNASLPRPPLGAESCPSAAAPAPPGVQAGTPAGFPAPGTAANAPPTKALYKRPALSEADQLAIRAEIGAASKGHEGLKINVHHYRARLERLAQRIPDFASYRKMVIDDLREAWYYDRMHRTRTVRSQLEQWKHLFPYWAERTGETRRIKIRSLGHSGTYECELTEPPLPDIWEQFIDIGVRAGAPLAVLNDVYLQFKDAPAKTVRAGQKFSKHGTGPVALPRASIDPAAKKSGKPT